MISILFSLNSLTEFSLSVSLFAGILQIFWVKKVVGNYTNISIIFVVFSLLYGMSGPINVLWGEGLPLIYSKPYNVNEFLCVLALSNIGLIIGMSLYNLVNINTYQKSKILIINESNFQRLFIVMINVSVILVFIGTIFELINLFRVGGIQILFQGKAVYQSLVASLSLTLPSSIMVQIGFSILALSLSYISLKQIKIPIIIRIKILVIIILSIPFITISLILGRRGELVSIFICILIGITYFKPIKKINIKLVTILIIFYVLLGFIFANRGIIPLLKDNPETFIELALEKERIVKALNPGANEFGSTFGNYSEFYNKYGVDFIPQLGETYIKGLVLFIPSFLYPGEKPKQITYEFRDELFSSEAQRGTIAGTGFSSVLEAYMNFKSFGVFVVFIFYGFILQKIDKFYRYKNYTSMLIYITISPLAISFHRSALGVIFSDLILKTIVIFLVFYLCRILISLSYKRI